MDICAALRDVYMDPRALDQVVAEHLYHEGAFAAGDAFVADAGVPDGAELKKPYASMHGVLERLKLRELGPALQWAAANSAELRRGGRAAPSDLEFSLHRLAFLQALAQGGQDKALAYARTSLAQFAVSHLPQLQRLMGALCFASRAGTGGGGGPYADLFSGSLWDEAARDFVRQSCALLGQVRAACSCGRPRFCSQHRPQSRPPAPHACGALLRACRRRTVRCWWLPLLARRRCPRC